MASSARVRSGSSTVSHAIYNFDVGSQGARRDGVNLPKHKFISGSGDE